MNLLSNRRTYYYTQETKTRIKPNHMRSGGHTGMF